MNFLTPPTDNLYKFCAIVGLIIMAASFYWPINAINNWGDKSLAFTQGKTNAQYDQKVLDSDEKYAFAAVKPTAQQLHEFEIRQMNIDRQNAVLAPIGAPIIEYRMLFKYVTQEWPYTLGFGFLLTLVGFWYWYFNVQRYEDKAARLSSATKAASPEEGEAKKNDSLAEKQAQERKAES